MNDPRDLRKLTREELPALADELRQYIVDSVSKTGGHLSSNLGTVELSIALHYVFDTPHDRIVWDVGHQSYAHKILTGRREGMAGGLMLRFAVLQELAERAGGVPVDNTKVTYSGFGDDAAVNAGVRRYTGDAAAMAYANARLRLTGETARPVVFMANVADEVIPSQTSSRYLNLARNADRGDQVFELPPVGNGHCRFGPEAESAALAKLREARARSRVQKLTRREREVLAGVADGLSNRLIGERLAISPRTVEIYRARLLRKYQAGSSVELVQKLAGI